MTAPADRAVEAEEFAPPHQTGRGERRRPFDVAAGRFVARSRLALGSLYWLAWLSFSRQSVVATGTQRELEALGVGALKLVTGASLLVGLIATFQVAYQLAQYTAEVMSVRVIAWFAARELGPVGVALLVVARSSPAIAGELASMRANREIDALRAMGLDPVKYLVAPKLAALLIALPALTILSNCLIILGGWLGCTLFLGFSTSFFVEQFRVAFEMRDLVIGLAKSVLFAFIIVVVAADEGLNVEGRVPSIGQAATRAVVYSLIGVLAMDVVMNAVFYFIPGLV